MFKWSKRWVAFLLKILKCLTVFNIEYDINKSYNNNFYGYIWKSYW
jgi:hypothetical protein